MPKASKNEIAGWIGDALKVRVTAPPERGKANEAVVQILATTLDVAPELVRLITGATRERKTLEVRGMSDAEMHRRLELAQNRSIRLPS